MKLAHYNASIQWDDSPPYHKLRTAVVTLPDGSQVTIEKRSWGGDYETTSGSYSVGGECYLLGDSRFETFDDLIQKGFGLTREEQ